MLDVNSLIREEQEIYKNTPFFSKTNPNFKEITEGLYYQSTGSSFSVTYNGTKQGFVHVSNGAISFYDVNTKEYGKYVDETRELDCCIIPNSSNRGVVFLQKTIFENQDVLISSGLLTGCTVCSVYIPDVNLIYFFHVGRNGYKDHNEYPQQAKNADLYRCIMTRLFGKGFEDVLTLSDDELNEKLFRYIASLTQNIFINIYISSQSSLNGGKVDSSVVPAFNRNVKKTYKYSTENGYVLTKYYSERAEMVVSKSDMLFSCFFNEVFSNDEGLHLRSTVLKENIVKSRG